MSKPKIDLALEVAASVAVSFGRRAQAQGLSDDVRQEAALAALRAVRSYKPSNGIELRKHVARRVKDHLTDFLNREERMVAVDDTELERAAQFAMGEHGRVDPMLYDPFFSANLEELEARHAEWEAERAARWADIRNGGIAEDAVAA